MLNLTTVYTCTYWAVMSSRQRTSVMPGYPDLQKVWNRTTNTPLIVLSSKTMPFKELGLGVTILTGKKSENGHQSTE